METQARRASEEAREGVLGALNRTALVFAGIYMTWGFVLQDARDFWNLDLARQPGQVFDDAFAGRESTVGAGLSSLDPKISLIAMAVAFVIKTFFARRHEANNGRFSGILATFGELAFVFYGLNATYTVVSARSEWVGHRSVVPTWHEWVGNAEKSIPGW
jgi:hypothetical protein